MTGCSSIAKKPGLIAQQEIDDAQSKDLVTEAQPPPPTPLSPPPDNR